MSHYQSDCGKDAPCSSPQRGRVEGSSARPLPSATTSFLRPPATRPTTPQQQCSCPAERAPTRIPRPRPPSQYGQYLTVPGQPQRIQDEPQIQRQTQLQIPTESQQRPQQYVVRSQQRSQSQAPPQRVAYQPLSIPHSGLVRPAGTKSATRIGQPCRTTPQICSYEQRLSKERSGRPRHTAIQPEDSILNKGFIMPSSECPTPSPNERRFREIADRANRTPISATTICYPASPATPLGRRPQLSPAEMRLREMAATVGRSNIANTSFQFPESPPPITPGLHDIAFNYGAGRQASPHRSQQLARPRPHSSERYRWNNLVNESAKYSLQDTSCPCVQSPEPTTPIREQNRWDNLVNEAARYSLGNESCVCVSSPEATPPGSHQPRRRTPTSLEAYGWDDLALKAKGYSLGDTSCVCVPSPVATPSKSQQPPRRNPPGMERERWGDLVLQAKGYSLADTSCPCVSSPEATPTRYQRQPRFSPPNFYGYETPPRSEQPARPLPPGLESYRWSNLVDESAGQHSLMNDYMDLDECNCDE